MKRRSGMSMAEVLVALFLLALGTIAILTMFPLGMYHMGQALKDDRTAQAANQANSYMRNYWRQNMVELGGAAEPCFRALDNPSDPLVVPAPYQKAAALQIATTSNDPSYPVCVDPMGFGTFWGTTNTASMQFWVGDQFPPRRPLATIPNALRVCSLMDGFTFDPDGSTPNNGGNQYAVERELRYNWLWVLQRPRNSDRMTATMKIVVYEGRAFQFAPPNAERAVSTLSPAASFGGVSGLPGYTTVSFPAGTNLGVNKGKWIADVTTLNYQYIAGNPTAFTPWVRNFNFYRIVSVTDTGTSVEVELQEPLRRDSLSATDPLGNAIPALPATQVRTFVVMAGVSEVFEFPMLPN